MVAGHARPRRLRGRRSPRLRQVLLLHPHLVEIGSKQKRQGSQPQPGGLRRQPRCRWMLKATSLQTLATTELDASAAEIAEANFSETSR